MNWPARADRAQAGSGTFVSGKARRVPVVADFSNVLTHLVEMGRRTAVRLFVLRLHGAHARLGEDLKLEAGERVQRSVRVRLIDGQPFSYLVTHVPERIAFPIPRRIWPPRRCWSC